ncbi:MAG: saccharopine dehydrogenase C-terminal domain-containing protein [Desulfobacterales bacterium]|jgi:saccharopine dehydrogenase-like NADP-dependent oxidoreductase
MKITILGAGKVGTTIALMLHKSDFCSDIRIGDIVEQPDFGSFVPRAYTRLDFKDPIALGKLISGRDAVVSAAPFYLNRTIAETCARERVAYFDLTEDVETTTFIRALAQNAAVPFVPQCGLAPGAINIIGSSYARRFKTVRSLELRVGALPLYASNSMKYYLSWSTAGLINEYCQLAEALYNGRRINALPLEGLERLTIDGTEYEAFNTSGGVATMCETFEGCVSDLNYKTIRYPGHRDLMRFLLHDLNLGRNRHVLTQIFDQEVPLTEQDVVIMYVNVVGSDEGPVMQRNFVKKIYGRLIDGTSLSAIQLSTAAGLVAILELFSRGSLKPGFVKQEDIAVEDFFMTHWGHAIYDPACEKSPHYPPACNH